MYSFFRIESFITYNTVTACVNEIQNVMTNRKPVLKQRNLTEMKPKATEDPQDRVFQAHLRNMINMRHELALFYKKMNGKAFKDKFFEAYMQDVDRPCLITRLMVGQHLLKSLCDLSVEAVSERFIENIYRQIFLRY